MPNLPEMPKYQKRNSIKEHEQPIDELINYINKIEEYLPEDAKGQIGQCRVIRRKAIQLRDKNKFAVKLE